ncbi:hypothetical protein ACFQL4_25570 [Halosimplex aquaticum]
MGLVVGREVLVLRIRIVAAFRRVVVDAETDHRTEERDDADDSYQRMHAPE